MYRFGIGCIHWIYSSCRSLKRFILSGVTRLGDALIVGLLLSFDVDSTLSVHKIHE